MINGTRPGSGKIVYEQLITIWGSANTESLPFGVQGDDYDEDQYAIITGKNMENIQPGYT